LDFKKRNVEIYLHGTILPEIKGEPSEESVDLYVYRYAEKKAIQIGQVTRLLKTIAVDCILNIGQTNLTVEKIAQMVENQNISIQLSSMNEPIPFKVGDKPFTEICDYMDNCSFKCRPEPKEDLNIIYDTYNNDFIKINYSMIVKRIRQIFKEQNVIKKPQLVSSINVLKQYPEEQIDYVLSSFVDNKNELLYDKYGRTGYLINKELFYAFQPIEISDENASVYDRSVPIEFKHESLILELPATKPIGTNTNMPSILPDKSISSEHQTIIESIKTNLQNTLLKSDLETKEKDWFKHTGHVVEILKTTHKIPIETLTKYIIYHNLDILTVPQKLSMVRYLHGEIKPVIDNNFEIHIKQYFDEKIMNTNITKGIILSNSSYSNFSLYIQDAEDKSVWNIAEDTDYDDFKEQIITKYLIHPSRLGATVGFIHPFEKDNIVFKTKVMGEGGNNKGVTCWKVGKSKSILRLNEVLGKTMYDNKNTKNILSDGICIMIEMIMRYQTDKNNENGNIGKVNFLDLEKTLVNQLITL